MRGYLAYSQADAAFVVAAIGIALAGAWLGCVLMGGADSGCPHFFYIAIVLAAVRFPWPAAAATALAAGVLAGPFLPADVASGAHQELSAWLLRLVMFVAIGTFITLLVRGPEATLRSRLQDAVSSARLLRALKSDAVEVHYQPIYRIADHQIVGAEALVRWRQSTGQYANPGWFIPALERTGAIAQLDAFVLRRAVATTHAWPHVDRSFSLSVNLSAFTLLQPEIIDTVAGVLEQHGLPAHSLQLEITESAFVEDLPAAVRQVEALRRLGVKVAIDDFGAGQASLNYLQNFPVDVVKLDRSMLTVATVDRRSRLLLEGVVNMCGSLDMAVIVEGVETSDDLSLLRDINVPMAQGFLLGRPAPAHAFQVLLEHGHSDNLA